MSTDIRCTLLADLEVDKVLSEGQVVRHYGCSLAAVPTDILIFNAYLAPTHHSMSYQEVHFVALAHKLTRLSAASLRHLAGVAEMRRLLNAPREEWRSQPRAGFTSEHPDAVWESPAGPVAIEYDAGSYSPQKIIQKINGFRRFERQIWGSPSLRRVEHLNAFLENAGEFASSIFATWC